MKLITKILLVTLCIATCYTLKAETSRKRLDQDQIDPLLSNIQKKCGSFEGSRIDTEELKNEIVAISEIFKKIELNKDEKAFVKDVAGFLIPKAKFIKL